MRYITKYRIVFLFLLIIISISKCQGEPTNIVDDISKELLLEEYPQNGVFSLRLAAEGYSSRQGEQNCNPTNNEYIQILCDAQTKCKSTQGTAQLVCMYDAMKKPIGQYERSQKRNKDKEEKVNRHHDEDAFSAWKDIKEIHKKLKHFVHDINEENEIEHDDHSDSLNSTDSIVKKVQEIYTMIQSVKEKYSPTGDVQILVKISSVEVQHPENGWVQINNEELEIDLATFDLNRLIAIDILEPATYTAVRITFAEPNAIRIKQPIKTTPIDPATISYHHMLYPLVFNPSDSKYRNINLPIPIVRSKATELC